MGQKGDNTFPLQDKRILVVDDEFLIAVVIEGVLRDAGASVVIASTLDAALEAAQGEAFSTALLDVRLGSQTTQEAGTVLARRGIPFVFYSGQVLPDAMKQLFPDARVLTKPLAMSALVEALVQSLETVR